MSRTFVPEPCEVANTDRYHSAGVEGLRLVDGWVKGSRAFPISDLSLQCGDRFRHRVLRLAVNLNCATNDRNPPRGGPPRRVGRSLTKRAAFASLYRWP